jgi:hypothetical protein
MVVETGHYDAATVSKIMIFSCLNKVVYERMVQRKEIECVNADRMWYEGKGAGISST